MSTNVFIIADHALFLGMLRDFINALPDLIVCGVAAYEQGFSIQFENIVPDVVVVDLSYDDTDATELVQELRAHYPILPIIIYSTYREPDHIQQIMAAGVRGFAMKHPTVKLDGVIWQVLDGEIYVSDQNTLS